MSWPLQDMSLSGAEPDSRRQGPWSNDRLGSSIRAGLADVRHARPSSQAWQHIAAATVDAGRAPAVQAATITRPVSPRARLDVLAWLDLRRLAFLGTVGGLVLAVGLALGQGALPPSVVSPNAVADVAFPSDAFSEAELRIQPGATDRLVNRLLPPVPAPGEPATAKWFLLAN